MENFSTYSKKALFPIALVLAIVAVCYPDILACNKSLNNFIENILFPGLAVIISVHMLAVEKLSQSLGSVISSLKIRRKQANMEGDSSAAEQAARGIAAAVKIKIDVQRGVFWLWAYLLVTAFISPAKEYVSSNVGLAILSASAVLILLASLRLAVETSAGSVQLEPLIEDIKAYEDGDQAPGAEAVQKTPIASTVTRTQTVNVTLK